MATIRKNPGNPFKVATKMLKSATGRVKTAVKNTQKTSTRKTTSSSSAPVTGKSRVNTKLMDAATKNLPNVTVKAKRQPAKAVKPTYERGQSKSFNRSKGGSTYYAIPSGISRDSATFMNQLKTANPAAYQDALKFMKSQQAKSPGARFQFGPNPTSTDAIGVKAGTGTPKVSKNASMKRGQTFYDTFTPRITTLNRKKGKK
jgi:hypothetical protein